MDETRHEKDVHPKVKEGLSVFKKGGKFLIYFIEPNSRVPSCSWASDIMWWYSFSQLD